MYPEVIYLHEYSLPWSFACLLSKKLYAGYTKCVFSHTQVEYLCHIIGGGVIAIDPAKMRAIMDWPEPTCVKHV